MFDQCIAYLSNTNLLKGGVLITITWWAWFKRDNRDPYNREHVILILFSCIVAIVLARTLALTSPFRLRPVHEEGLHFLLPYGSTRATLSGWSSFPSDHAAMFFSLSTGLLFTHRQAGAFALFYSTLFIAFPRIYVGLHYPTDIIAGAIIGITIALIVNVYLVKNTMIQSIVNLSYSRPNVFYPLFFLFTYQLVDMFNDSRALVGGVLKLVRSIIT